MKALVLTVVLLMSGLAHAGTCGQGSSGRGVYRARNGYVQKMTNRGWTNVFRYKKIYYVYRNGTCVGITTCQYGRGRVYPTQ